MAAKMRMLESLREEMEGGWCNFNINSKKKKKENRKFEN